MPDTLPIRSSREHWEELSSLLWDFERCYVVCARLDAHRPVSRVIGEDHEGLLPFHRRLRQLRDRLDVEIDRVNAEGLTAELEARMRRDQKCGSAAA